jgi:hypothetical protein
MPPSPPRKEVTGMEHIETLETSEDELLAYSEPEIDDMEDLDLCMAWAA